MIELGYAARSLGWDRILLVANKTDGYSIDDLPFDIKQHRKPFEYEYSSATTNVDKVLNKLSEHLTLGINECQKSILIRAQEMAATLDPECIGLVAKNEKHRIIEMPLPAKTMGQIMASSTPSIRKLIEIGAIKAKFEEYPCYIWTTDGRRMIEYINNTQPKLFQIFNS